MLSKDRFAEIFGLEMYAWCKGLEGYPGEMYPELMRAIIGDLRESFLESIKHNYAFDVTVLADSFAEVTKYRVHPKEISFYMLAQLPHPSELSTEDEQLVLADLIDSVEQKYGGALERVERRWQQEVKEKRAA